MSIFQQKVYNIVKEIPRGRVATYRAVAHAAGMDAASRAVGNALHKNPFSRVPCHRVICSDGSLGGFARGTHKKKQLLLEEGVQCKEGRVFEEYILRILK